MVINSFFKHTISDTSWLSLCFLVSIPLGAWSQQDPHYSQYMYNPQVINPAYIGSKEVVSMGILHRSQWLGLDGAPRTQTLTFSSPLQQIDQVGVGLSVVNDAIGPARETYLAGDFSYSLDFGNRGEQISFGLKAGMHLLNVDFNQLNIFDAGDPRGGNNIDNLIAPTIGLGLFYHTDQFYVGLAAPNVLQTDHFGEDNATSFVAEEEVHYFLHTGYVFDLSEQIKFKPAMMTKFLVNAPLQWDVSANFLLNDIFTAGVAYRYNAAITGLVGVQVSEPLFLGFAYDREATMLGSAIYDDGSFELFARYEFLTTRNDKMLTPRFF